ncbi:MAG: thioredoxin domain-containing protein [Saprospiraceae bacterium]
MTIYSKHIPVINLFKSLFITSLFLHCTSPPTNHLLNSTSPYLLEHLDNPVDWYPWSDEAFELAKKENKLVLISIGYSSCHWCHVMEEETFMNDTIAKFMNEHFVSIKVDREERPDIDQIYMHALQLVQGSGGWPANIFVLPDGQPFHGLTYLPPAEWSAMIHQIANLYQSQPGKIKQQALLLSHEISVDPLISVPVSTGGFTNKEYQNMSDSIIPFIDVRFGGLKGAPKFPMPMVWEFLLQQFYANKDSVLLHHVTRTLDGIYLGGIYDHLEGGFARYSTDEQWAVPHFEKMLYDNAMLISLYSKAYQITQNPLYKRIIVQTLTFIEHHFKTSDGYFYSSMNADSEGKEGKYYTWTSKELTSILSMEELVLFKNNFAFDFRSEEPQVIQLYTGIKPNDNVTDAIKAKLLSKRKSRIPPSIDTKIIIAWNALMIEAYTDAYQAIGDSLYIRQAIQTAGLFMKFHKTFPSLAHILSSTPISPAFLDDYAQLSNAFLGLYQSTFDTNYLQEAKLLTDQALQRFNDSASSLLFYSPSEVNLITRKKEISDEVIPSSNAVLARVLYKLGTYYQDSSYLNKSRNMIQSVYSTLKKDPAYYAAWGLLAGEMINGMTELVILGNESLSYNTEISKQYLPFTISMGGNKEILPLMENKLQAGKTMIYVCRNKVCQLPVDEVSEALKQIFSLNK